MTRTVMTGARGLAGVTLTFVIAWALTAVILLTGILVATHQIERDVGVINPALASIHGHTVDVALAVTTHQLTSEIETAAAPLTGQLASVLTDVGQINATVGTILQRAQSINSTVVAIHSVVLAIGSTVGSIGANVASIQSSVNGIAASVNSVGSDVARVLTDVQQIHASGESIQASASGILTEVHLIQPQIPPINQKADAILTAVTNGTGPSIDSDLGSGNPSILGDVGTTISIPTAENTIDGHANAIDCSTLLNTSGGSLQSLLAGLLGGPTMDCGTH